MDQLLGIVRISPFTEKQLSLNCFSISHLMYEPFQQRDKIYVLWMRRGKGPSSNNKESNW